MLLHIWAEVVRQRQAARKRLGLSNATPERPFPRGGSSVPTWRLEAALAWPGLAVAPLLPSLGICGVFLKAPCPQRRLLLEFSVPPVPTLSMPLTPALSPLPVRPLPPLFLPWFAKPIFSGERLSCFETSKLSALFFHPSTC